MPDGWDSRLQPEPLIYSDAVALLERALVFGMHPSLDGIGELVEALGRPHGEFASVQVTGTNGKTSVTRITEAILRAHGARTGLYTSPHLERYPERIAIDGEPLEDAEFARAVGAALAAARSGRGDDAVGGDAGYTEFELLTAAALWSFAEHAVDTAVLEVGLGGRWDATSVVSPAVAVITGVGLDHTAILGDTLEQIAAEKAAIISPGSIAVLGPGTACVESVFLDRAQERAVRALAVREAGAPTPFAEHSTVRYELRERPHGVVGVTRLSVRGAHADYPGLAIAAPAYQAANIATAVAAAEARFGSALDAEALRTALATLSLPGRFEVMRAESPVVVDGSHNPQAAAVLAAAVEDAWPDSEHRPTLLLGVFADKDAAGIAAALAPVAAAVVVTAPESPRARSAEDLAAIVEAATGVAPRVIGSLGDALDELLGTSPDGLLITGSLATAGQARGLLRDRLATERE